MIIPQDDSPIIGPSRDGPHYAGHAHFWERAMLSRRQIIKTAVATTGAVLSSGLWMPALAHADNSAPRPIPGGVAPGVHVFLPGSGSEPSTITDFHGFIGVAALRGAGTGINTKTDQEQRLVFDVDVRFMQGVFIGLDGELHGGTFAFIWLDLYKGQVVPANQIHDFNPGNASSGLFWTIRIPSESVEVDLDEETASMELGIVDVEDFFTLANALKKGHHIPASVFFHIRWHGVKKRHRFHDTKNHFVGKFIEDTATIRWSAREKGFKFVSDPAHTSTTVFAEIGRERNGAFFS